MTKQQNLKFNPDIIGFELKEQTQALNAWRDLVEISTELLTQVINFLDKEDYPIKDFMELISLETEDAIIRLFRLTGNKYEGMDIKKLIELGLLNNIHAKDVKKNLSLFKNVYAKAIAMFNYDLSNLRNEYGFDLDESFQKALQEHFTVYTSSVEQNEALKKIKQITDGLNYFVKKGLVSTVAGTHGLNPILNGIELMPDRKGFEPKPKLFKLSKWKAIFC